MKRKDIQDLLRSTKEALGVDPGVVIGSALSVLGCSVEVLSAEGNGFGGTRYMIEVYGKVIYGNSPSWTNIILDCIHEKYLADHEMYRGISSLDFEYMGIEKDDEHPAVGIIGNAEFDSYGCPLVADGNNAYWYISTGSCD